MNTTNKTKNNFRYCGRCTFSPFSGGNKSAVAVSEQSQALSVLKICKSWGSVKRECSAGMEQTSGGRHGFLGTSGCAPEGKQTKSRIRCVPLCGHASENAQTRRFCSETVLNVTKSVGARIVQKYPRTTMKQHDVTSRTITS